MPPPAQSARLLVEELLSLCVKPRRHAVMLEMTHVSCMALGGSLCVCGPLLQRGGGHTLACRQTPAKAYTICMHTECIVTNDKDACRACAAFHCARLSPPPTPTTPPFPASC